MPRIQYQEMKCSFCGVYLATFEFSCPCGACDNCCWCHDPDSLDGIDREETE